MSRQGSHRASSTTSLRRESVQLCFLLAYFSSPVAQQARVFDMKQQLLWL